MSLAVRREFPLFIPDFDCGMPPDDLCCCGDGKRILVAVRLSPQFDMTALCQQTEAIRGMARHFCFNAEFIRNL